jgi:hypothetical protein
LSRSCEVESDISNFTMADSCSLVGAMAACACPSVASSAWWVRSVTRLVWNVSALFNGATVSRPSNISALRNPRLADGSGRRYTDRMRLPVERSTVSAQPYGSYTVSTVNCALSGTGNATRIKPWLTRRLCADASLRDTPEQLAPSTSANSGSEPPVDANLAAVLALLNPNASLTR